MFSSFLMPLAQEKEKGEEVAVAFDDLKKRGPKRGKKKKKWAPCGRGKREGGRS